MRDSSATTCIAHTHAEKGVAAPFRRLEEWQPGMPAAKLRGALKLYGELVDHE